MARGMVWHPFTQAGLDQAEVKIARASGAWLETSDNRRILDVISSWWVITHGHRYPPIIEAIREQASMLDQVIFAGLTHEPAEALADALVAMAPQGLDHVFYSDSGSTAVEVAIKMAVGYWKNIGAPRHRIVALEHGYHGDTIGTMSAGARGVFNAAYEPLLFDVKHIPFPHAGQEQITLDALAQALEEQPTAALVVEPLIAGAGGMLIYSPACLQAMKKLTEKYDALFIADEVMTGWGRTGTLFACEQASITPDILCTSKGLTGGSVPLAATLATARIYEAHFSSDRTKTLFHSSSYTANPIACAAALANTKVWRDEPVRQRIARLSNLQTAGLARLAGVEGFSNARQIGTITAIDLDVADKGYLANAGQILREAFLAKGLLIRPLGNTIYVMPPFCTRDFEIDLIYDTIARAPRIIA